MRAVLLVLGVAGVMSLPDRSAYAQQRPPASTLQAGAEVEWHVARPPAPAPAQTRGLDSEILVRQSVAGLVGGVAGSLVILLPLAAAQRGDAGVSDDAMTVGAVLGYIGGSSVGVQLYSRRVGMNGSWWMTLGGATVGALGGPAMIVTVPIGAVAGFNLSRYLEGG